jgi:hypothetical protein
MFIDISTAWKTDGPEALFEELLDWQGVPAIADTPSKDLDLADAYYDFSIGGLTFRARSLAENYDFDHKNLDADGYCTVAGCHLKWSFFDYRSFVTSGAVGPEKSYLKNVVRPRIVENFKGETEFKVTVLPLLEDCPMH